MPIDCATLSRPGEARRDLRFELQLGAALRTEAGEAPIKLLDVSCGGALAEARFPLRVGTRVTLCLERLEVEASIIWEKGGRFGLAFERPIRATDLFFQLGRSRAAARSVANAAPPMRSAVGA